MDSDLIMIETQFYIMTEEQYNQFSIDAQQLNVTVDYFLSEFCDVIGEIVQVANKY